MFLKFFSNKRNKTVITNIINNRKKHLCCFGIVGTDKDLLMLKLIKKDIENGNSIIIINPEPGDSFYYKMVYLFKQNKFIRDFYYITSNFSKTTASKVIREFFYKISDYKNAILLIQPSFFITRLYTPVLLKHIYTLLYICIQEMIHKKLEINPSLSIYIYNDENVLYSGIENLFIENKSNNIFLNVFSCGVDEIEYQLGKKQSAKLLNSIDTFLFFRNPDYQTTKFFNSLSGYNEKELLKLEQREFFWIDKKNNKTKKCLLNRESNYV